MKVSKKTKTEVKITIELSEWEARDLEKILSRIKNKPSVSKSEFSLREKSTGRRLLDLLELTQAIFGKAT